jgi:hypothetical protein
VQTTSKKTVQQFFTIMGSLISLSAFVVACGPLGSSSPAKKYEKLRANTIPAKPYVDREQTFVGSDVYTIKSETNLDFIAGQMSEVRIKAMLQIPGAQYQLTSQDLPQGAKLTADPNNPLFAILSWQPAPDFIPRGQREIKGEFHVSIEVQSVPDPQSETLLRTINTETTLYYTVSIAQDRPRIVAITGLPDQITENTVINDFKVEVDDTVSSLGNPPSLEIYYKGSESAEGAKANGTMFVALKGLEERKDGQKNWVFSLNFDTKTFAVPEFNNEGQRNKAKSLDVTFYLKAVAANGAMSPETKVDRSIVYSKTILKPQFSISQKSIEVFQGANVHLAFSTMLTNGRGTLSIKLDDSVSGWPGKPSLSCEDTKDSAVELHICDFAWKIPCDAKEGDYTVHVMAGGTYNNEKSSADLTKTIKVRKADVCQPPKPEVIRPEKKKEESKVKKTSRKKAGKRAVERKKTVKPSTPEKKK